MRLGRHDIARLVAEAQRLERLEADIAARQRRGPPADAASLIDFLEVPTGDAFDVTPAKAIAYFAAKGLKPTFSYADMLDYQHDQAFTVAKMMGIDMLGQVRASLDAALASGQSFKEWSDTITPVLQSGGWWGRKAVIDPLSGQEVVAQLGSPWRLETIFRTNMQTAYAAGAWQEIEAQKDLAPYLMYDAIDDLRTRPLHASWDQKVLPVTADWWKSHYPPNGWNCRCGVIQLSLGEVEAMGLKVQADPPDDGTYKWTNPRTGQVAEIPRGLDPGFEHNAGLLQAMKAKLAQAEAEKIALLQSDMKAAARKQQQLVKENVAGHVASANAAQAEAAAAQAKAALARAKAMAEEKAKQWAAQQQLDLIAKGKESAGAGAAHKIKALADLKKGAGWSTMRPAEQLQAVLDQAAALKAKAVLAGNLSNYKKAILAGKVPPPAAAKAFKSLEADDPGAAAAWLKKVDDEKAAIAAKAAQEAAAKAAIAQMPAPAIVRGAAPNPAAMTKIGEQKGSNPGGTYQDTETGIAWYVKQPASADIARNEVLAGKLYEAAGIDVPEMHLIDLNGRASIASRIVEGLSKGSAQTLATAPATAEGFAVDAWLANWDVVGLGFDNLLMRGARAFRVDTGGALRYRAQGTLKGAAFGDRVTELESLRDASLNRQAADVFGRLTDRQIEDSVVAVLRVRDDAIEQLVEEFGPRDAIERSALAARLIARKADLARRYPGAAARAQDRDSAAAAPKVPARVTEAEQGFVEAARVNGYGFATDGDAIEDNMVLVHTYRTEAGAEKTRGWAKLRPQAGAELLRQIGKTASAANAIDLADARDAILAAVKSINVRAWKGQALDATVVMKIEILVPKADAAIKALDASILIDKAPALAANRAILATWRDRLAGLLDDARAGKRATMLAEQFPDKAIPSSLSFKALPVQAQPDGLKWERRGRFSYHQTALERSHPTETATQVEMPGVSLHYVADLPDGTRIAYFPHSSGNAYAMQGVMSIDAPGRGQASTGRVFEAIKTAGVASERADALARRHLYLNAFARLKIVRDPKVLAQFNAISEAGEDGVRAKLAFLKRATGVDVEASDGWQQVDGVRQAFGHGRAYQLRPDLSAAEMERLNATHTVFHNPNNLGHDAGAGVFDRMKPIIDGGGMLSSLTDRVRRGVRVSEYEGTSVGRDLQTGGGDYIFTRILARAGQRGAGLYWKASALRRMDAVTYTGDKFGNTTPGFMEAHRGGQDVDALKAAATSGSNETIFKAGLSLFDDLDRMVLASEAEVKAAIAWLRDRGYTSWPDGRRLEDVIITKARHAKS